MAIEYNWDGNKNFTPGLYARRYIRRAGNIKLPADVKANQVVTGYNGVKFDEKGQNILASSLITQMQGGKYVPVWPKDKAAGELKLPYKGW